MMEIFVGNLPFDCTEEEIRGAFSPYGEVASVRMLTDRISGRFRGIAYVVMNGDAEAASAIENLNGKDLKGRPMRVDKSRPRTRFNGFGAGFSGNRRPFHGGKNAYPNGADGGSGNADAPRRGFGDYRRKGDFHHRKETPFKPKGEFKRRRFDRFQDADDAPGDGSPED